MRKCESIRIIYLSYDGLTDPLGQSQILPYIEGLSRKGYWFTLVSFEKPGRYKRLKGQLEKRCAASGIDWKPLAYTKEPPVASTLYDIEKLWKEAERIHREAPFDFVHCRSYIPALVGVRLKRKYGIPFIFDMRGFWADERVDGKIWNTANPLYSKIYRFFKTRERQFLEEATAVVSLTHAGKTEIENWYETDPIFGGSDNYYNYDRTLAVQRKTRVIPCATDLELFDYRNISENKRKWLGAVHGIDTTLEYLGYVGSMGTWYMAEEMLLLYAQLYRARPNLRFLILSHDNIDALREKADKMGIPRSYIVQVAAERKQVPALMSLMTASVFFILPAYSKKASSPTKQGELMAMGVPLICNAGVGDTGAIVKESKAGMVLDKLDTESYAAVAQNWESLITLPRENIREGAERYFSLTDGIEAYADIYREVAEKHHTTSATA